jgi:hypothetical protein
VKPLSLIKQKTKLDTAAMTPPPREAALAHKTKNKA